MDLNPLSTPRDVLTDCLNGTIITYNGDEFSLQTDMGNSVVLVPGDDTENPNSLPHGFIPLGMKEFNNILYIVAHNPLTKESRIGSIPSPQRYQPMYNEKSENLVSKTISGTNGTSIQELTKDLTTVGYINHGMNLLTSFLNRGDKYRIEIKIGEGTDSATSREILSKFINNYGTLQEGYFDLNYYALNVDGNLTPLEVNITPNDIAETSDIYYTPDPFNQSPDQVNGKTFVHTKDGAAVIVATLTPKSINSFNFKLQGYNVGGFLRARVVFKPELVDITGSAIRVKTIKISTTNTELEGTTIRYYDYENQIDVDPEVIIDQLDNGSPIGFTEGTIVTVTCTPIDQFGRELSDKAVTKSYTITKVLLGTDAHSVFQYKVENTTLTVKYNFLNTGDTDITQTRIEFYDFWSGVSVLGPLTNFTSIVDREVITTFTLSTANLASNVFDSNTRGGIPVSTLSAPAANQRIIGTSLTSAPLRANHCYLIRIHGIENSIDYSVFQILYTLPINIFSSNYGTVTNFGTIDIISGMLNKVLDFTYTGSLFGTTPIVQTSTTPNYGASTSNYTREGGNVSEAYRLYGGPVFEEFDGVETSSWKNNKYYRNIYDKSFYKEGVILNSIGYHNFPESSIGSFALVDGSVLQPSLFGSGSKHYLKGGLTAPATNSQKDFKFNIKSEVKVIGTPISGTITIAPTSNNIPLLFGSMDMKILGKKITLSNYVSGTVTTLDAVCTIDNSNITETLHWNITPSIIDSTVKSTKARIVVTSGDIADTVSINDLEINTQRFTYGNSAFKYYTRSFARDKVFKYFTLSNTQTIKVKIVLYPSDYNIVENHKDYVFSGSVDTNYDVIITDNGGFQSASTKYNLVAGSPSFTATLNWNDTGALSLPIFIQTIGHKNTSLPLGDTSIIVNSALHQGESLVSFCSFPGFNTIDQYVYQTYKSTKPSNFKLYTNNTALELYRFSNLWRWDDYSTYIAVEDTVSNSYLSNLVLYQSYQEVIIAQYPVGPYMYNTADSTTSVSLTNNTIKYYTRSNNNINDKHLTRSCFGSSVLESFNINKFISIINGWLTAHTTGIKLVYDFTNIDLSEGYAKNIPWNYIPSLIGSFNMANITMELKASSAVSDLTIFTNSEASLLASPYMLSDTNILPTIKGINNNQLTTLSSNYFQLESVLPIQNINKSAIFVPQLSKTALMGRIINFNSPLYGITSKLAAPPTITDMINSAGLKVGDLFAGGIIFVLNKDINGVVTGGKIVALSDCLEKEYWLVASLSDSTPCTMTGGDSITDGYNNSLLMKGISCTSNGIMKQITAYRDTTYGFSDWYLPAVVEMTELITSAAYVKGLYSLKTDQEYWTSTEHSANEVFMYKVNGIDDYNTFPVQKTSYGKRIARPIRKF